MSKLEGAINLPSKLLAIKVAEALVKEKLILESDAQRFIQSLASGKLKAEDWRVLVEKAIDEEATHEVAVPLKSLVVEHLRGAVMPFQLTFEKGKKLSIIYGENGTGKSTICDALDFLGNSNVGSLDNRGLGKTTRYWHSLGRKPEDVSVTLEVGNGKCVAG